jgi:hypothetical protein|tara:strand:- start:556 stop:921 length:366 start_codon:yes stop_codon:yes gene_type:complete
MPLTPNDIFYADTSTAMSVADISSLMATSIDAQIDRLEQTGVVDSAAARDAIYPVPVQGNSVFRADLGIRQTYYTAWNATTNPGGRGTVAAWVDELRQFVQATAPGAATYITPRLNETWVF